MGSLLNHIEKKENFKESPQFGTQAVTLVSNKTGKIEAL